MTTHLLYLNAQVNQDGIYKMTDLPDDTTLKQFFDNPEGIDNETKQALKEVLRDYCALATPSDYFSRPSKDYTCRFCGYKMVLRKGYTTSCVGCAHQNIKTNIEWL